MMKDIRINSVGEDITQANASTVTYDQPEIWSLVRRATGGDVDAFGDLYSIYLGSIYRYVFYHVRDKMIAEDITQEVFVKAWKAIGSCKGKERTFSPWLYRIAHNQVIDVFRSAPKHTTIDMPAESLLQTSDVEKETEVRSEWEQALEAISRLPEKQKHVIILKFIEGMDNREIEKITDINQTAIRVLQMRALNTLRQQLHKGI